MKIALDVQSLFEEKKTGIGWTVKMLVEHLVCDKENEYRLNYFAFRKKKKRHEQLLPYCNGNTTIQACEWMPLGIYRRIWRILSIPYSLFFQKESDITQFFNYVIPPGVKGKTAVFVYDMVYQAFPETMEEATRLYMERETYRSCIRADAIITISQFSKLEIMKYWNIPEDRIHVVPCGVDLSIYQPGIAEDKIDDIKKSYMISGEYFLYLGTLEPRKNISIIIKAYCLFAKRIEEKVPKLVIAGKKGWNYDSLFSEVKEMAMENYIQFTGYVEEYSKPALLAGAIGFIFPSLYEGFGMPPLESMACGTPVIVSNTASLPEVVGDGGILVDCDDCDEISNQIERLYVDENYRTQWSDAGLRRAQLFTWENSAKQLLNVYKVL